jgi:small subunit ribosomal protein S8
LSGDNSAGKKAREQNMSLSDPIADMLTRVRNSVRIKNRHVSIRASRVCAAIASVLKAEGYIEDFERIEDATPQGLLRVTLKYDQTGRSAIEQIKRVSKPGRRVYSSVEDLPIVMNGMGISIVSTSKGMMSDKSCRQAKIGGEIICTVC